MSLVHQKLGYTAGILGFLLDPEVLALFLCWYELCFIGPATRETVSDFPKAARNPIHMDSRFLLTCFTSLPSLKEWPTPSSGTRARLSRAKCLLLARERSSRLLGSNLGQCHSLSLRSRSNSSGARRRGGNNMRSWTLRTSRSRSGISLHCSGHLGKRQKKNTVSNLTANHHFHRQLKIFYVLQSCAGERIYSEDHFSDHTMKSNDA